MASTQAPHLTGSAARIVLTEEDYYTGPNPWTTILAAYHKLNPNVTFKRTVIDQNDYIPQVLNQAGAKGLPDIVMLDNPYVDEVASTGVLSPLESLGNLPISGIVSTELRDGEYNGKLYALPMYTNTEAIFYNKKMFAAAHLTPPKTWAEFISDAKALTTPQHYGYVDSLLPGGDNAVWRLFPYIWTNAGTDAVQHLLSSEVVAGLNVFTQLARDGSMPKSVVTWNDQEKDDYFNTGRAAMMDEGIWDLPTENAVKGLDYGVIPIPVPKLGDRLYVPTGGETWTIPTTDSPQAKAATFAFFKWLDTPKVDAYVSVLFSCIPTIKSAIPATLKQLDPRAAVFAQELVGGGTARTPTFANPLQFDAIGNMLGDAMDATVLGKSATQALQSIASQVEALDK